jgi:multimeric flavodoxin WrbA
MSTTSVRVAIAFHSGYGHTAKQAEAVANGARSVEGTTVDLLSVDQPDDELLAALDQADAIIFGAPTYMGAASAVFKTFAETTSKAWGDNLRWKDKVAAGFTNSQNINGNKENTLLELFVLAAQHGMHWVSLGLFAGWNTTTASADDLNRLGSFTGAMAQSHGDAGPGPGAPRPATCPRRAPRPSASPRSPRSSGPDASRPPRRLSHGGRVRGVRGRDHERRRLTVPTLGLDRERGLQLVREHGSADRWLAVLITARADGTPRRRWSTPECSPTP